MNTLETFDLPGKKTPLQEIENLPHIPRTLNMTGLHADIIVRILWFLFIAMVSLIAIHYLFEYSEKNSSITAWITIFAICPITFFAFPQWLFLGLRARQKTFETNLDIYKTGTPTTGSIVMISFVHGHNYSCYYAKQKHRNFMRRVRVDYTFNVDNELKTGSLFIKQKNAKFLACNDEICVLYKPDDPSKNIIFPLPGEELCSTCLRKSIKQFI